MNNQQFEFDLGCAPIHPYQILDALSPQEEGIEELKIRNKAAHSSFAAAIPNAPSHHYLHLSGNPYASIQNEGGYSSNLHISATGFTKEATRIFKQYSPTVGKYRKLRPEFRLFVKTQAAKEPCQRTRVISELRKYDLEAGGLASPLFNREMSDRILKSLNKIAAE